MIHQEKTKDIVAEYTSLSLAISKLVEGQEKDWGCFQVKKEGEFYALYLPNLPSFKLYQNQKSLIYRGYWRKDSELPRPTDVKSFPPDLWIKKKQKKVSVTEGGVSKKTTRKASTSTAPTLIYDFQSKAKAKPIQKIKTVEKKQRIYEIAYKYHNVAEVKIINQLIANFLKEKIIASIVSVPEGEILPLVVVGNPE